MSLLRLENHSGEIRFCFKYHLMLIKFSPSNSHTYEKKVFWFDLINYSLLLFRFDHFTPFLGFKLRIVIFIESPGRIIILIESNLKVVIGSPFYFLHQTNSVLRHHIFAQSIIRHFSIVSRNLRANEDVTKLNFTII